MPSITLTSDSAFVDGVPVPVTTGSYKDVLVYLEKQKAKAGPKTEELAKVEVTAEVESKTEELAKVESKTEDPAKVEAKAVQKK